MTRHRKINAIQGVALVVQTPVSRLMFVVQVHCPACGTLRPGFSTVPYDLPNRLCGICREHEFQWTEYNLGMRYAGDTKISDLPF